MFGENRSKVEPNSIIESKLSLTESMIDTKFELEIEFRNILRHTYYIVIRKGLRRGQGSRRLRSFKSG